MTVVGRVRWSDDRGVAGGAETVPFVVLIFVIGGLMVANLWSVINTKMAANAAAREAAHAIAEASPPGATDGDRHAQVHAVADVAAASALETFLGKPPDRAGFIVDPPVYPRTRRWQRCAEFTVDVHVEAPLIRLPMVGALGVTTTVSATASSLVDPYRDSATVVGQC